MQENQLTQDEKIFVELTPDKMIGVVSFESPLGEGKYLTPEAIRNAIHAKGIKAGIQEEVIHTLLKERKYHYKYVVAKGVPPKKGENAWLDYAFDVHTINDVQPKEREDGTVDFKELNLIYNVHQGDILATKKQATKGEEGVNVLGEPIRAVPGKDVRMPRGKNTTLLEDGVTLVASIDGKVCYDQYNIYISPSYIVEKDVDSSTGNIDFLGNVIVNGNVQSGFKITAIGTVEVKGCVEGAEIRSGEHVIVHHGIQGMDKGFIQAKGNVVAKFIQNARIEAGDDVIAECIMHSKVGAATVQAAKGKGFIVGGEIIATKSIVAAHIGSHMATHTMLQIGVSPELTKAFQEVGKARKKYKEELDQITKSISFLISKKEQLRQDKQVLLEKLLATRTEAEKKYKEATYTYKELATKVKYVNEGFIKVKEKLHPGVKIIIGTAIKYIYEEYSYCTIQKEGPDIEVLPY